MPDFEETLFAAKPPHECQHLRGLLGRLLQWRCSLQSLVVRSLVELRGELRRCSHGGGACREASVCGRAAAGVCKHTQRVSKVKLPSLRMCATQYRRAHRGAAA